MSNLHRIALLIIALFAFNAFAGPSPALAAGMTVTPQQGTYTTTYTFNATGFNANENVSVGARLLDGTVVGLPSTTADGSGNAQFTVTPGSNWPMGTVIVTATGQSSGHSYSAGFHLVQASSLGIAAISPNNGTYSTSFNVQGSGFIGLETVDVAAFFPDGNAVGLPSLTADHLGNINFNVTPYSEWPTGRVTIVASGASSARKVTGPFQLSHASNGLSISTWNGEYYNNTSLSGNPAITRTDAAVSFYWGSGSPDPAISVDNFSARWTATATVSNAGNYNIQATSDDGMRVWVDNNLVIDQWNDHPATTYNTTVYLGTGGHSLKVEYYEHLDQAVAVLNMTAQ